MLMTGLYCPTGARSGARTVVAGINHIMQDLPSQVALGPFTAQRLQEGSAAHHSGVPRGEASVPNLPRCSYRLNVDWATC